MTKIDELRDAGIDNPHSAASALAQQGVSYGMGSPEVGAVMAFMDSGYLDRHPNAAQEWAEQLLDEASGYANGIREEEDREGEEEREREWDNAHDPDLHASYGESTSPETDPAEGIPAAVPLAGDLQT